MHSQNFYVADIKIAAERSHTNEVVYKKIDHLVSIASFIARSVTAIQAVLGSLVATKIFLILYC